MNTSSTLDFIFASTLTTVVVAGLVMAGMASALVVGTIAGGAYLLSTL